MVQVGRSGEVVQLGRQFRVASERNKYFEGRQNGSGLGAATSVRTGPQLSIRADIGNWLLKQGATHRK